MSPLVDWKTGSSRPLTPSRVQPPATPTRSVSQPRLHVEKAVENAGTDRREIKPAAGRRLSHQPASFSRQSSVRSTTGRASLGPRTESAPLPSSDSSATTTVTFQGARIDDSLKTQIASLRSDHAAAYQQSHGQQEPNDDDDDEDMRIRVVVRKRPMTKHEIAAGGDIDIIHPLDHGTHGKILLYQPRTRVDLTKEVETIPFCFDNVFDEQASNMEIYERSVRGLIPSLFQGQWASIFAYGQTGSGKTFTMMGSNLTGHRDGSSSYSTENLGLYYMAALDLFEVLRRPDYRDTFSVAASLFEIYGGKLYDLMNDRRPIKCLEDSKGQVVFRDLSQHALSDADRLMALIEVGAQKRSTGTTSRNADSSRCK
jgi:Kinesin motor domain